MTPFDAVLIKTVREYQPYTRRGWGLLPREVSEFLPMSRHPATIRKDFNRLCSEGQLMRCGARKGYRVPVRPPDYPQTVTIPPFPRGGGLGAALAWAAWVRELAA